MIVILNYLVILSFILCYAITALYDYHMFQLNSYSLWTQLKWLKANFSRGYIVRHILALPIIGIAFFDFYTAAILSSLLFLIQCFFNRPRKAKKPLVYTSRVKRMLVTNILILAIPVLLSFSLQAPYQIIILALGVLCTPLIVLLSNIINMPIEKGINRWYINDAKKILKSMDKLVVIGITGSYGKTSTKYFLNKILSSKYNVLMTPESYNTPMGVVKTIRTSLKSFHEIFICEMGAKYTGEIKEICDIVNPKYGIITSIGPQHLETFKSIENIIKTKFELADALPDDGVIFLNHESDYIRNAATNKKRVSYAISPRGCNYEAKNIHVSNNGSAFDVILSGGRECHFETKLIGVHNVENILGSIAAADYLGVDADTVAMSVRRLESVPHRLQLLNRGGMAIIDDAFNSNINGAKMAIDVLNTFEGFKILVTPGMVELGNLQDSCNREFGAKAAESCDYVILVGAKQTGSILEGLKSGNYPEEKVFIAGTIEEAFRKIESINSKGFQKVVLLENDLPDNY
ncbi:Mur ligase family protein [Treponema primitia]|uniref:Mur ligase family protein n=1 Tax=Treponema primitia TaxID=88058 RepID=UPI00025550B4|nr:UDP-N-acetylmuramoyl-tripeptide--D-alanyl-D-alanine ligase [Treponema primitia]